MSLLIFTQLDEILLSSEESSSRSIAEAIASLQSKNIPLVPITSKTRAETVDWMQKNRVVEVLPKRSHLYSQKIFL